MHVLLRSENIAVQREAATAVANISAHGNSIILLVQ